MQHCIKGEQYEDLKLLMEHVFQGVEWKHYLDTHPWDEEALASFRQLQHKAQSLEQAFLAKNPWMSDDCCGIFPWELNYECE